MVKTTINLDDELYRKLIEESIRKFGSTKKLSFLINEKLRRFESEAYKKEAVVEKSFGLWRDWKISSEEYVRRIRKESEKRVKRLGI